MTRKSLLLSAIVFAIAGLLVGSPRAANLPRGARGGSAPSRMGERLFPATPGAAPASGFSSCRSEEPGHICLSVRYAAYADPADGTPSVDAATAERNIETINEIWKQCDLGFEIDDFKVIRPGDQGLHYRPSTFTDFDQVRGSLDESDKLLVVTTGTWERGRGMTANAWTTMPGEAGPFGAVLEKPVGNFGNIVAHELGHYLGLSHYGNSANVMNATIYSRSMQLTSAQCSAARGAATRYWSAMLR